MWILKLKEKMDNTVMFGKLAYWAILAYFDINRGLVGQTSQC